jgi:mycothiol synthase
VNVRPIDPAVDLPALVALFRADEEALRGRPSHVEEADVRMWLTRTDLEQDSWLLEDEGLLVAAGWGGLEGEAGEFAGIVAQGAKGRGLGLLLVERGEASAAAKGVPLVRTWVPPEDVSAAALLGGRGYREVRRFYEMAIELQSEPVVPALPAPLVLETFREEDAAGFHAAMIESFQDHWEWHGPPFDEWWTLRRDDDHSLWFLVRDGNELAAVVRNEARETGGYVGLLGVRRPWRGRGLGKALLHRAFAEFWRRGLTRVSLGVDAESPTGATKLYERLGMTVESATVIYERSLA